MFYKKYIFETRSTRSKRILRTFLFSVILLFIFINLLCVYMPIYAYNQNEITEQAFFKRSPDVIAVFTGDIGRIDYTLKKAEKHPSAKIFITGVYAKNSLKTLLLSQGKNISVDEYLEQESHHIEIDYLARNTIENGLNTIRYLQTLGEHKNILISYLKISSVLMNISERETKGDAVGFGSTSPVFYNTKDQDESSTATSASLGMGYMF